MFYDTILKNRFAQRAANQAQLAQMREAQGQSLSNLLDSTGNSHRALLNAATTIDENGRDRSAESELAKQKRIFEASENQAEREARAALQRSEHRNNIELAGFRASRQEGLEGMKAAKKTELEKEKKRLEYESTTTPLKEMTKRLREIIEADAKNKLPGALESLQNKVGSFIPGAMSSERMQTLAELDTLGSKLHRGMFSLHGGGKMTGTQQDSAKELDRIEKERINSKDPLDVQLGKLKAIELQLAINPLEGMKAIQEMPQKERKQMAKLGPYLRQMRLSWTILSSISFNLSGSASRLSPYTLISCPASTA